MENTQDEMQKEKNLQWHPAFYATAQIELQEEAAYLEFENEHQLSTKPMSIDVLIIKNEQNRKIKKNIGSIFRKYNLVEYKSPNDYISIDTFYKIYGYACFYKADTGGADTISIEDMTITLFGSRYPRALIKHLKEVRGYRVVKQEAGIYYVYGDRIPIQILVGNELSPEENLWLRSLTNELKSPEIMGRLLEDYQKHKENTWYQSAMDIIVRANEKKIKEDKEMACDALMELMTDLMADQLEERLREGMEKGIEQGIEKGIEQGIEQGIEKGVEQGEGRVNKLYSHLINLNRKDDIFKAIENKEYQEKLFKEFGL